MASRIVFASKLVGTVSLGLLTGVSYTLSTMTVPVLLDLPSASHASRAFGALTKFASSTVGLFAGASGVPFLLSFALSPRGHRHPYLLYTGLFCFAAGLTETLAPYVLSSSSPSGSSGLAQRRATLAQARRRQQEKQAAAAAKRMEQSYEVLGESTTTAADYSHSESGGDFAYQEEEINGEEVREEVQAFVKRQLVQTVVAGLGFAMSIVGIWGDGVTPKIVIVRG